jgi:hypothetical protein
MFLGEGKAAHRPAASLFKNGKNRMVFGFGESRFLQNNVHLIIDWR